MTEDRDSNGDVVGLRCSSRASARAFQILTAGRQPVSVRVAALLAGSVPLKHISVNAALTWRPHTHYQSDAKHTAGTWSRG